MRFLRRRLLAPICLAASFVISTPPEAAEPASPPILIGLNADMSASLALGGEAIRRGAVIAIDEINRAGGVLGRPLDLVVRDHRGNRDRGVNNIHALAAVKDLVAVMGGIHPSAVGAELEAINRHRLLYLEPWANGADAVDNDPASNFVFRVSALDDRMGEFLIAAALERGYRHLAFVFWKSAWGRSNGAALRAALKAHGREPAAIEWVNQETETIADRLETIRLAGADVVMLIAPPDGAEMMVHDMAARPPSERLPIIAHWGFTASGFHQQIQDDLGGVDLTFLQTFSFLDPPFPDRAEKVLDGYCTHFDLCDGPVSVVAPGATAHAYDLVHLLARAINGAGSTERHQVRQALETLKRHDGLVRRYEPPFTPGHHDAPGLESLRLAAYDKNGVIVPLDLP